MLMKQEHENLRAAPVSRAFIPLPRVARATSPTRWATCPAKDHDLRMTNVARPRDCECLKHVLTGAAYCGPRAPLGLGLVEYIMPVFSPAPRKIETGKCAIARCGATSFCFLPLGIFLVVKKQHLFRSKLEYLEILSLRCIRLVQV